MSVQQFTRIDPEQNVRRWYTIYCGPTLFGDWGIVRSWGRIGSNQSQRLIQQFPTADEARAEVESQTQRRLKRGYTIRT